MLTPSWRNLMTMHSIQESSDSGVVGHSAAHPRTGPKLATDGFVVAVPDLYHGKVATEPDEAQKMVMMIRAQC